MKGFFSALMMCAYILGTIGGFGYSAYGGSWPIAIAVAILGYMAWPQFVKYYHNCTDSPKTLFEKYKRL